MKVYTTLLLGVFFLAQVPYAQAATPVDDLILQVESISSYLEYQQGLADKLSAEEMRQIILGSEKWEVAAQEESGHFGYEYVPFEDKYLDDDNMIRQAGTLFALSEVYKRSENKDTDTAKAIEKAITYFQSANLKGKSADEEFLCIKSSIKGRVCSLGSASLALIGILNYVEAHPEKKAKYDKTIKQYVAYILASKIDGAGFSGSYSAGVGFITVKPCWR
jgi:hypothetical protein